MALTVFASNILVQFLLLDGLLTWGAFTYPIAFLITDLTNRFYGPHQARKVVFSGFITGIVCSLIGSQIMLQGDGYEYPAVALRIAVGSGCAFLVAQLIDIFVFNKFREGYWWRAPLISTIIGSFLDTILFFTISFSKLITFFPSYANDEISWAWSISPFLTVGFDAPLWISLAFADWIVKLSVALLALVPFRVITKKHYRT